MSNKTIAAIATPVGDGALGVIRISGEKAIEISDKIFFAFSKKKLCELEGYSAAYGEIIENGKRLDDAVALVFKAPHSYTGEDTVEISVHGGILMLRSILRLILNRGAELALAGEFTERAFLNGKTDLTRAESIMGLISAKSEAELKLSRNAHNGKVADRIYKITSDLKVLGASIAAYSDYPDEDIEGLSLENFTEKLSYAQLGLEKMLKEYDSGKLLREGIVTAIVGRPNVGKSTLMNMLSGEERSIVTDVAGTTRDIIEETVVLGDITLRLADTAGIHDTKDKVESIGVNLAKQRIETSQLILAVFDCTQPLTKEDYDLLKQIEDKKALIIINKTDLENKIDLAALSNFNVVEISAKTGSGYEELCESISKISGIESISADSAILINERQRNCAMRSLDAVKEAIFALESCCTIDAVGVCVDDALSALLELTGQRVTNEITDEIFRRFCVGK